jgi:hypothetical protein
MAATRKNTSARSGGLDGLLLMHLGEEDEFISKAAPADIGGCALKQADKGVSKPPTAVSFDRAWRAAASRRSKASLASLALSRRLSVSRISTS